MSAAEATRHRKHLTHFLPGASSVAHSSPPAARWSNRNRYARSAQSENGRDRTSSGYPVTGTSSGHRGPGGYARADHRRELPRTAPAGQLYPFSSVGGPNNQYLQLTLAALAAKASGRTLLLAPFVKWSHNAGTLAKNFSSTFDVDALARFVPVRSLSAPRAFRFTAVSQVVTAGGAPSTDNFRTLCYVAGLPCDADALKASATGFGSEVLARCKRQVKPDGSYMRCLLSRWADRSALGFSAWGFGKVKEFWGDILTPTTRLLYTSLRRAPRIVAAARSLTHRLFPPSPAGARRPLLCVHLRRLENEQRCRASQPGNRPKISCQPGHRLFASTTQLVAGIRHLSALLGGADVYVARAIVPLASKPKWPFAAEGAQLKASIPGLQSLTPLEMAQRLRDPSLRDNYLASLVEQEICSQASAFLGTIDSTWTQLVLLQRAAQAHTSPARASASATAAAAAGCSSSLERAMLGAPRATTWGAGAASPQRDADAEDNMFDVPALIAPVAASAGWSECRSVPRQPAPRRDGERAGGRDGGRYV